MNVFRIPGPFTTNTANEMTSMKTTQNLIQICLLGVVVLLFAGCNTLKTVPPLYTAMPQNDEPSQPPQIPRRSPPEPKSFPIVIKIPKKDSVVEAGNSITRPGAIIKPGSSVVISVPKDFAANLANSKQSDASPTNGNTSDFKTDEYFNDLEQYIERGLIAVGFQAKDRSKFEAKLRDLRESSKAARTSSYTIALADLTKELENGKISRDEFAAQDKKLQEKLDPTGGVGKQKTEMTDISEVIRAAQSGDIMADYVLQVNTLAVQDFAGEPMQLDKRPEVLAVLDQNPGLRIGDENGAGHSLPATIPQPWSQAIFNAKLIEVKTGSIDWSGEFSVESLAVLEDGIKITIGVRRQTSNGKAITNAISDYNARVSGAYQDAVKAKHELDEKYREVMQPVEYKGNAQDGADIQNRRTSEVEAAKKIFAEQVAKYQAAIEGKPPEANVDWTYNYDVDTAIPDPDILKPKNEEEKQWKRNHDKALTRKVTSDLLQTIKMAKEEGAK